jgi:hypothetical protein
MENKDLLKKADLALADLSGGGLLNAEQSDTFIRKLIDQPTMLNQDFVRFVPMRSPQKKIEKIGLGKRILRAAAENTALATAAVDNTTFVAADEATARAKPQFSTVTLNVKEVIAELRIPYGVMEDNIERAEAATNGAPNSAPGGIHQTLLELIGERAAIDLEELALTGDTASTDTYLGLVDGWLKNAAANANTVDVANATVSKAMFKAGLKAMPTKYRSRPSDLVNILHWNQELEYRDTLADRVGALGDGMTTGAMPATAYSVPVKGNATMPLDKGLLSNPKNFIFGIHRDVSLEYDKDITTREYIVVLTARVDFKIEETEAVVYYKNINVG